MFLPRRNFYYIHLNECFPLMQHPDQKYIDALLNNDPLLVAELYAAYFGKIKAMILQNSGTEADAADIFQDALLSVYHKAKKEGFIITDSLYAFLYVVCRNKWIKEINKKKLLKVTFTDNMEPYGNQADVCSIMDHYMRSKERKMLILEKLETLGDSCKKILRHSWSGKRMDAVARELNVSYAYARKKKSECMAKLVKMVRGSEHYNALK